MPTTFIDDPLYLRENCNDPDHEPPTMIVIPPGKIMKHVCPRCDRIIYMRRSGVGVVRTENLAEAIHDRRLRIPENRAPGEQHSGAAEYVSGGSSRP